MGVCSAYIGFYEPGGGKKNVVSDLVRMSDQLELRLPIALQLIYMLHYNRYYRNLFYHRIGPVKAMLLKWYRPGDKYFNIRSGMPIGEGMWIAHPYSTILAAESIGKNFGCIHCTTIGKAFGKSPIIGDNVFCGCNVTIIGGVKIGNNVTVGAGSVVVKDVPDNCVVAGNPAKIIRYTSSEYES